MTADFNGKVCTTWVQSKLQLVTFIISDESAERSLDKWPLLSRSEKSFISLRPTRSLEMSRPKSLPSLADYRRGFLTKVQMSRVSQKLLATSIKHTAFLTAFPSSDIMRQKTSFILSHEVIPSSTAEDALNLDRFMSSNWNPFCRGFPPLDTSVCLGVFHYFKRSICYGS